MTTFLFFMLSSVAPFFAQTVKTDTTKIQLNERQHNVLLKEQQNSETLLQSSSTISGKRLLHRPTFQLEQTLDGTLPGLFVDLTQGYPTEKSGLKMRGRNLLIVVDGIPRADSNIPPSQIESVTLIKDAVGLAAWGMSSGDGVLFIKTKRGNISKLQIDFTSQYANAQQIYRPQFLNSYEYATLLNQGRVNDGDLPIYSQGDLDKYKDHLNPYTHPDVDWYSALMRKTAPIQQYNLNMAGGSSSAKYFIDLNVYNQQGFLKQDKSINSYNTSESFKKFSLRTNVDIQLSKSTLLSVNVFGQMFRENTPGKTMMGNIYNALHTTPNNAYAITNPLSDLNGDGVLDKTYAGNSVYTNNLYAQSIESGYIMYPKTDFNFDLVLEHQLTNILKGLYVKGIYSYNSSYREQMNRTKGFEIWEYKPQSGLPVDDPHNYTKILSAASPTRSTSYSRQNRMQYVEASLGYNLDKDEHHSNSKLTYWSNEYILKTNELPMIKHGFNFNTDYDFAKRYLAEVNISYMKMNYLSPSKQWGFFPTAGLGWNISKEEFFNIKQINNLKLKTTYGENGNDGTGSFFRSGTGSLSNYYFPYIKLYKDGSAVYLGQTNASLNTLVESGIPYDPEYEKSRRFTLALDASAFNNTLKATIEYFNNFHYDILGVNVSKGYSSLYGIDAQLENIVRYSQQGLELDLEYNKTFGQVNVQTNLQATFYKTKLINNGEPTYPESYMQRVGHPYGQMFGYVANGFFQSQAEIDEYLQSNSLDGYIPKPGDLKYEDLNNDHIIDGLDVKDIGTKGPRIEYGMYLNIEWKGLAFETQWAGLGNVRTFLIDMPFEINSSNSYGQALKEHLDYWREDNPNATYPRISAKGNSYNERSSTFWIKNISFLRLKNVELSYSLPKSWVKAIQLNGVKFFVNAYNALTITPLKNRDPELLYYTTSSTGIVPNSKAYNVGINVQF